MLDTLEIWHRIVETGDATALGTLLADDVVFESPVVHTPQHGKAIATTYLRGALHVLNNESFRYVNEWHAERSAVLEFATEVDGITIDGVDIISWNAGGEIDRFKVMVRPLKAINVLHVKMGELLAKMAAAT